MCAATFHAHTHAALSFDQDHTCTAVPCAGQAGRNIDSMTYISWKSHRASVRDLSTHCGSHSVVRVASEPCRKVIPGFSACCKREEQTSTISFNEMKVLLLLCEESDKEKARSTRVKKRQKERKKGAEIQWKYYIPPETHHEQTDGWFRHELDSHDGIVLQILGMGGRCEFPAGMLFVCPLLHSGCKLTSVQMKSFNSLPPPVPLCG